MSRDFAKYIYINENDINNIEKQYWINYDEIIHHIYEDLYKIKVGFFQSLEKNICQYLANFYSSLYNIYVEYKSKFNEYLKYINENNDLDFNDALELLEQYYVKINQTVRCYERNTNDVDPACGKKLKPNPLKKGFSQNF